MIVGRIAGALRRQDWMAVVIELIVVVLGLFLGLQLNAWKEGRDASVREQLALERLLQEAEADVHYFRRLIAVTGKRIEKQERALAALSTGDKQRMTPSELASAVGSLGIYPGIAPPRAVYEELTGSGQMGDIGSLEVRSAIASYYSQLGFTQSQLDYFRQYITMQQAWQSSRGWTSRYDPKAPEIRDRFAETLDFDVVAHDREQMMFIIDQFRNQMKFQGYHEGVAAKAEAMCKALAEALRKTCATETPSAVN
jgi:hypothetical protein